MKIKRILFILTIIKRVNTRIVRLTKLRSSIIEINNAESGVEPQPPIANGGGLQGRNQGGKGG